MPEYSEGTKVLLPDVRHTSSITCSRNYPNSLSNQQNTLMNCKMESIQENNSVKTYGGKSMELRENKLPHYKVNMPAVVNSGASIIQAASIVARRAPRIRRFSGSAPSLGENTHRLETSQHSQLFLKGKLSDSPVVTNLATNSSLVDNHLTSTKDHQLNTFHRVNSQSQIAGATTVSRNSHQFLHVKPITDDVQSYKRTSQRQLPTKASTQGEIIVTSQPEYIPSKSRSRSILHQIHTNIRKNNSRRSAGKPHSPKLACLLQNGINSHADAVYSIGLCNYALNMSGQSLTSLHLQPIESMMYDKSPLFEVELSSWWYHLMAGGAAGAVSRTCTAPLDRLKVMRMVGGTKTSAHSMCSMFRHMLKEGGVTALWRGNAINVAKVMPESALKFAIYEQVKNSLSSRAYKNKGERQGLGVGDRLIAGSCAGLVSQSVIYPMEVIKTTMVLRTTGQYSSIIDCICKMIKSHGFMAFYRGYVPNMIGIIPYSGIDLAVYETLKRFCKTKSSFLSSASEEPLTIVLLTCGIISSTCGQLVTYPLSLVRTRLQAQVTVSGMRKNGMLQEILQIHQAEGLKGFYRGLTANFLKVAPAVGISYAVYENVRSFLGVTMT